MKCSVCQRDLAPSLSMCVRCGAMRNDSIREELESSITPLATPVRFHFVEDRTDAVPVTAAEDRQPVPEVKPSVHVLPETKPPFRKVQTTDLAIKKTSPTLADFVTRNATLPDWRLQLQNSVRQRSSRVSAITADAIASETSHARPQTNGANALKHDYAEARVEPVNPDDKIANALKRIEDSRRAYLPTEKAREGMRKAKEASRKFPYTLVHKSDELPKIQAGPKAEPATTIRPKLISSMKIEKKEYDTNKLVPIPEAAYLASSFAGDSEPEQKPLKENWSQKIEIREKGPGEEVKPQELPFVEEPEIEADEIDDLAPISMRFNAGLFDLIIGSFATFVLLSPFLAMSEGWFSLTGIGLFASILLVVMFIYLTASIAFLGQTFGMKIFSLELIDAEESEFPTLHQSAVNSAVYLLSLMLGGIGLVPIFMNEERRAVHDLISGTILVREI